MSLKPRVLWIEDSARFELRNLVGPLFFSNKYEFNLAEDVTTAAEYLRGKPYQAVIVDIRLPPGIDPAWRKLYQQTGFDKVRAKLGLKLLRWLLTGDLSIHPSIPPTGIKPQTIGVFTVESHHEIQGYLGELGITVFKQKSAGLADTVLLDLIDELLNKAMAQDSKG